MDAVLWDNEKHKMPQENASLAPTVEAIDVIFDPVVTMVILIAMVIVAISIAYTDGKSNWYTRLPKPDWQPPNWLFGAFWSYNYVVLLVNMVYGLRNMRNEDAELSDQRLLIGLTLLNFLLGATWTVMFFRMHSMIASKAMMVIVLLETLALFIYSQKYSKTSLLLIPYIGWLFCALLLAFYY